MSDGRLVIGNLDFEVELAGSTSPPQLKQAVVERISAAAATLSVFADRVYTLAPIDPERVIGRPELLSGPLADAARGAPGLLAWGETPAIAALRGPAEAGEASTDWVAALWQCVPDPELARRCNRKTLALGLGRPLPDARVIESLAELEAHLAEAEAGAGDWVVKAPWSAAGRERLRQRGRALGPEARARIVRLLEAGPLLFEPWVQRMADLAVAGVVTDGGALRLPAHQLITDEAGVFRGIEVGGPAILDDDERRVLDDVVDGATRYLHREGYRGPFGIDAYLYRTPDGRRRLQPLSELNARLTFGHVAHAWAARTGAASLRFELGARPPDGAELLVRPERGSPGAWLCSIAGRGGNSA